MTSLFTILENIKKIGEETARALGRSVKIHLPPTDAQIPEYWQTPLTLALTHTVKNSVDHGMAHEIFFHVHTSSGNGHWVLEVEDRGTGVDFAKIKAQAVKAGLLQANDTPSQNALLELLFYPGFSTRTSATEHSGRGIGMDIIRHEILKLGGQVHLVQNPGQGLVVRIEIRH